MIFDRPLRIGFPYDGYLNDVWADIEGDYNPEKIADAYARELDAELSPLVRSGEIRTHRRYPLEAGGPGAEFDLVDFVLKAAGAYAAFRLIGDDVRAVIRKLGELGDGRVFVDDATAVVLAVDAVASEEMFVEIEVVSVDLLRGADEMETERGYIVELSVNGVAQRVVISASGSVLGGTDGIREELPRPPELDTPPPEPPAYEEYEVEEEEPPDLTGYIEGEDGNWYPGPEARELARKRLAELEADPKHQTPQRPKRRRPKT